MKSVLYVLDNFPKLSETFVLNEIVELINRGIDVNIIALRNPNEKTINEEVLNYGLLERTKYFYQDPLLRFRHCFSTSFYKNIARMFKDSPVKIWLKDMIALSYYSNLYKNVNIVHSHFAYNAAVTAMIISKIIKKPYTFTAHAYEIFRLPFYSRERLKILVENAAMVITPSEYNKNYIVKETGCDIKKIKIVRATISPEKFKKRHLNQREDKIKILSIGRLVEKKGFEYLIKAMKAVVKISPKASLNIIGAGKLEKDLIDMSDNLGLSNNVTFLGEQHNERCIEELASSCIVVLPCIKASNGDVDVCPLTLQEAMSMEIPIVSTTVGSVPELIDNDINGLLVPEKDENALSDAIIRLIDDPSLRKDMGIKGRGKIMREFNIGFQVNELLKIWRPLINKTANMEVFS